MERSDVKMLFDDPVSNMENIHTVPPSPAYFVECSGGSSSGRTQSTRVTTLFSKRRRHERLLSKTQISELMNYGSEDDDHECEDDVSDDREAPPVVPIPRALKLYYGMNREEPLNTVTPFIDYNWPLTTNAQISSSAPLTPPAPRVPLPVPQSEHELAVAHKPRFLFDFQWDKFPNPPIPPHERRECFTETNCGPTKIFATPYAAFTEIWDRQIMERIVLETNRYAQQLASTMQAQGILHPTSRITTWKDTNIEELYVYFSVLLAISSGYHSHYRKPSVRRITSSNITLAMGVIVKSRIEEYWEKSNDIFETPNFSSVMSLNRFHLLSRCLHFTDNTLLDLQTCTRSEAKLHKILPIIQHLNQKFSSLYTLKQNIALDESLLLWKDWLDIGQRIPNKAAGLGIKTYEVCECQTGYLWRFKVSAEPTNRQKDDPLSGTTTEAVIELLRGLEYKGYTVWMDNYYNSPALARHLKSIGFDVVGTIKSYRKFVPKQLMDLKLKHMAQGQISGCTSGDVDLLLWRDSNLVPLISTYHGVGITHCSDTLKPTLVADYNICMGGVDKKDQILAMYPIERKRTQIWYKKLFKRLLNVSVLNTYYILCGNTELAQRSQLLSHRMFRKTLTKQLLERHHQFRVPQPLPQTFRSTDHQLEYYPFVNGVSGARQRHRCAECGKRIITLCRRCAIPLCPVGCFHKRHL